MWNRSHIVAARIAADVRRYDFFQAVRLLDAAATADAEKDGNATANWALGPIRFQTRVNLAFAGHDIDRLVPALKPGDPAEMTVAFFGLTGSDAPLPQFFIEEIIDMEERQSGASALRAFLDLFNQRLLRLKYDVRALMRPGHLPGGRGTGNALHDSLYTLVGLAPREMRNRLPLSDAALFRYAGLLHGKRRSLHGLQVMLSDLFGLKVKCRSLTGGWHRLEPEDQCRLGVKGRNQRLGDNLILGTRAWDQSAKFSIHIDVPDWATFTDFLPVNDAQGYRRLTALVNLYLIHRYAYDLVLRLPAVAVPDRHRQHRLGWNSVLGGRSPTIRFIEVRLGSDISPDGWPDDPETVLGQPPLGVEVLHG